MGRGKQGRDTPQVAPRQTLRCCTIPRARGWLQPSSPGCCGFQLPRGWQGLVFRSKAGEDPHPEGQCLHVSSHLPPGNGIPQDYPGYLSQIPPQEAGSDAPLLSAVDPKAVSRLHSLFITACLFPVPPYPPDNGYAAS